MADLQQASCYVRIGEDKLLLNLNVYTNAQRSKIFLAHDCQDGAAGKHKLFYADDRDLLADDPNGA